MYSSASTDLVCDGVVAAERMSGVASVWRELGEFNGANTSAGDGPEVPDAGEELGTEYVGSMGGLYTLAHLEYTREKNEKKKKISVIFSKISLYFLFFHEFYYNRTYQ